LPILTDRTANEITIKTYSTDDTKEYNHRWWLTKEKDKIHEHVFYVTDALLINLTIRRRQNFFFATLYNDIGSAFTTNQATNLYYNRIAVSGGLMGYTRLVVNVLQNVIDTATSLIAKNKPKPQFVTDGAKDYSTKVKGKKLTKYVEGVFDKTHLYQIAQRIFQDACIYGTGCLKLFEQDGEIKAEWVFIEEMLIDDLEGIDQLPRQIHQRKYKPRDQMLEEFPEYAEDIMGALSVSGGLATLSTADLIPVIESWHLPSAPGAKDGLHTICIQTATLFSETYKKDYYPILFFRWADQTSGFWGRGISHELWKLQMELDTLMRMVQQSMRLVGGPVIAIESGSNITEDHITSNKIAKVVEYTVQPPTYLVPPTCQPEVFQHIQFLKQTMYEIAGVSESAATGNTPEQLKSAVAIREKNDATTGRFEIIGQRWEQFFLSIAKVIVDMSADMVKENKELSVLTKDKTGAERIMFKEVMTDIDDYELQLFPVSGLASTPAGRLDQLMDYAQAGYLTKEQVMDIVNFPDLEETVSLEVAAMHLTQQILSEIKEKGKYIPPGPYLDLQMAFRMASLEVDRATLQHVDEDNIDLLRRWVDECKSLMDQANQSQQAMQAQQQQQAGTPAQAGQAPQPLPQG